MFENVTVGLKEPATLAAVPVSAHAIPRSGYVLMPFVSLSCMPQNPPSSACSRCRIHSLSPIPKRRPNSSSQFCRLHAQLCNLASHCWLKIRKDRKKRNALDWTVMQYWCGAQGWEGSFALRLSPWNVTEICCINKPWMNSLILFCSYFKSFFPKAQAWFALSKPPAGKLGALQLLVFAACQSVFAVTGHQHL